MQLTRRQLATALASGAVALARTPPRTPAASRNEALEAARERLKNNAAELARHALPQAAEPAFQFKA